MIYTCLGCGDETPILYGVNDKWRCHPCALEEDRDIEYSQGAKRVVKQNCKYCGIELSRTNHRNTGITCVECKLIKIRENKKKYTLNKT